MLSRPESKLNLERSWLLVNQIIMHDWGYYTWSYISLLQLLPWLVLLMTECQNFQGKWSMLIWSHTYDGIRFQDTPFLVSYALSPLAITTYKCFIVYFLQILTSKPTSDNLGHNHAYCSNSLGTLLIYFLDYFPVSDLRTNPWSPGPNNEHCSNSLVT